MSGIAFKLAAVAVQAKAEINFRPPLETGFVADKIFYPRVCFLAMRPYQTPDAMKTPLQPAVNQTRNGTGK
jgi:hypothetical protein